MRKPMIGKFGSTRATVWLQRGIANVFEGRDFSKPQRTLRVGRQPFGIAFAPDANTVLVSIHGDGTISVLDLEKGRVEKTFKAGTGVETLFYH